MDIRVDGIIQNYEITRALASGSGIRLTAAIKGLGGYQPLIDCLLEAGVDSIAEAQLPNLVRLAGRSVEKWLIRLPPLSEVADIVRYADVSLNSELVTIQALGEAAVAQGRRHKVVVMVDLGERREGVMPDDVVAFAEAAARVDGVELYGLGASFGCFSGMAPSDDSLGVLVHVVDAVENALGVTLPVVSGGSSSAVKMLLEGRLPTRVNHLRVGETLLRGRVGDYETPVPGCCLDAFTLSAEILEIKNKPSRPSGTRVPGEVPIADDPRFPDEGVRRRALVGVGTQDTDLHHLFPVDDGVRVLGGSSDVLVADITESSCPYKVGDRMTFSLGYHAILRGMVSDFVEKNLIRG